MAVALGRSSQPSHETDLDVGKLVLDVVNRRVRGLDTRIDGAITGGTLERTIDGASTLTLTLHDPDRVLLRSGAFGYAIDVRLDRLYFRLVKVAKQDDELTLTFEDREVAYLRQNTAPKKASRVSVTRAEFALSLVREVRQGGGIPFVCPELHVRQKVEIENKKQERSDTSRARNREKGLNRKLKLTVKGSAADISQIRLGERVLDVADSLTAGEKASVALMAACIVESEVHNLSYGDRDSRGVLQVRDVTAQGMGLNNMDPAACANAFLRRGFYGQGGAIDLARQHPDWSAGTVAQQVQGSGHPERYDQRVAEAKDWIDAYSGAGVSASSRQVTKTLPYQFRRGSPDGEKEDSWTCLQRLAQEVNWRCFVSAGSLYFISELELLKAKPRLLLDEDSAGVLGIDFDVDSGKPVSELTVTARANRWVVAPGAVCQLQDCGPADGRWLVANISRGLFDATATITLRRPAAPLPEPAPETETLSVSTGGGISTKADVTLGSIAGSAVDKAYQAAQQIHGKRFPYVWGGGHARAGVPDHGQGSPYIGYDCSGGVSAVLAAGGMGLELLGPAKDSNAFMSWGEAGEGEHITVWSRPGTTTGHVFIVFHAGVGKSEDQHWGSGDWGKGWGGCGFNPRPHYTSSFSPRHWPGT